RGSEGKYEDEDGGLTVSGRIRAVFEDHVVVVLRSDRPRERTAEVVSGTDSAEYVGKVVARLPSKLAPCLVVHVDTIDRWKHPPSVRRVGVFVVRDALADHARCIGPEIPQVVAGRTRPR